MFIWKWYVLVLVLISDLGTLKEKKLFNDHKQECFNKI